MIKDVFGKLLKSLPYMSWFIRQELSLLRKKGVRAAYHYFHTLAFTAEDGLALMSPLYARNQAFFRYPVRIELETTTKCSLKCLKCEHTYWNERQQNLTYEKFLTIIKQFPKLKAISLSGIGHNFQNPDFMKMLEYTTSKGIFTQFFDTFLLWNDEIRSKIVDYGVTKIWMSIDGTTPDVLEKLQNGSKFHNVVENAKKLLEEKKRKKARFPELCFIIVVTKYNVHQLAQFIDLVEDIVADNQKTVFMDFIRLIPFEENEYLMPNIESLLQNQKSVIERAKRSQLTLKLSFIHFYSAVKKRPVSCCTEWMVPFILVDGTVYQCCGLTEGNQRRLVAPHTLGNVFDKPFSEIWNSRKFTELRKMLNKNQAPELCHLYRECTMYDAGPPLKTRDDCEIRVKQRAAGSRN